MYRRFLMKQLVVRVFMENEKIVNFQLDTSAIFTQWEKLVVKYQVLGKQAHDTRLVAAMLVHGMTHLLTFNTSDFRRFSEITAIDPRSISSEG